MYSTSTIMQNITPKKTDPDTIDEIWIEVEKASGHLQAARAMCIRDLPYGGSILARRIAQEEDHLMTNLSYDFRTLYSRPRPKPKRPGFTVDRGKYRSPPEEVDIWQIIS